MMRSVRAYLKVCSLGDVDIGVQIDAFVSEQYDPRITEHFIRTEFTTAFCLYRMLFDYDLRVQLQYEFCHRDQIIAFPGFGHAKDN